MPFRYDYSFDSETLIVRFPSTPHEVIAMHFAHRLCVHREEQQMAQPTRRIHWLTGTCLESKVIRPPDIPDILFVADVTVKNRINEPVLIIEVSLAQTRKDVTKKIRDRFSFCPSLVAAIIVNLDETPRYERPTSRATTAQTVKLQDWYELTAAHTGAGPIEAMGHLWLGKMTCSLEVWLRDDLDLTEAAPIITTHVRDHIRLTFISNPFSVLASYTRTHGRAYCAAGCRPHIAMAPRGPNICRRTSDTGGLSSQLGHIPGGHRRILRGESSRAI